MINEHKINSLDNFICGWYQTDNTICDKLISYFENSAKKRKGYIGSQAYHDPNLKDSTDVTLSVDDSLWLEYHRDYLQPVTNLYCEKYYYANQVDKWSVIEDVNIQKYTQGQAFHAWHFERFGSPGLNRLRHLVYMTYLNDVDDGGETEFFYQKVKVKPEKGLTLIWPSDWTFTHKGLPSLTETKYVVTGWYSYANE